MTERIIYGISKDECQGCCLYSIHLGYRDKWETTRKAYESQFFQDHKDIPDIPGWDKSTNPLGYETASETPVDLGGIRKTLDDLGYKECPEFEEALQKEISEMLELGVIPDITPDDLEEKYQEALKILKHGREVLLSSPEKIWAVMTSEEKEDLGDTPNVSVYYYHGELYVIMSGLDFTFGNLMIETRREILNEILKEYDR